jgi:dTMP kinase
LAYQGVARGLGVDAIQPIIDWAAEGLEPDVVVVLDVPDEVADARVPSERDRLEGEGVAFHAAVRRAYRELAPARGWVVVDGAPAPEQVAIAVWDAVRDRLGL